MNIRYPTNVISAVFIITTVLVGCTQIASVPQNPQPDTDGTTQADSNDAGFTQIPDLPIPPGSIMNIEQTFIVGSAESWYGQTQIEAPEGGNRIFDFFKQELPVYGWQELSTVRAQTSILTYTRGHRVLAIQLTELQLGNTEIMITVSPRGGSGGDLIQPVQ